MSANPQERLQRARIAQAGWIALSFSERTAYLKRLRHSLLEHSDRMVETVREELGKPAMDVLSGDVMVTLEQMLYYEKNAEAMLRTRSVRGSRIFLRGTKTRELYEPHGVALVIAPWNYPVQLSVIPSITALFAGNAVLCKCSEYVPHTAMLLQQIVKDAGLPVDLMQFSWGAAHEAQALLDARPDFVFFTGSSSNGRKVASRAGELLIPSAMELGGKDAALVFASCNFGRALNGLVYGAFSNCGQVCISAKRIYVESTLFNRFVEAFEAKTNSLRANDMGTIGVQHMRERLATQVSDAQDRGALISCVGDTNGTEAQPLILQQVPADARLLHEESFGPVVCIAPFHSEEEAIALANASDFGLSSSVWSSDMQQAERVVRALRTGSSVVNDVIRNVSHPGAAFGGIGASGYGRYHGQEGLRTFSRIKTVMVADGKSSTQINWFPFTRRTFLQLRGLLRFRHGRGKMMSRAKDLIMTLRGGEDEYIN